VDYTVEQLKAAYALNLCTVSISQIIDYRDINIMEQEYEAILNNLNLEEIPKDEALLNILKQLLDVITFFRIQEGEKAFVDRDYQQKMKNAIWSAVPNIGLIVAGGDPTTMAISLASQIGIGYMNYRKAKAEGSFEYDMKKWELERTAIEQFNGLRRELFDTAWRLADTYGFSDQLRLSERQIAQYNNILMDSDPWRKYERLDSIKDSFTAYPPFWYFFGNVANELSRSSSGDNAIYYKNAAKNYYEAFVQSFTAGNLLRENQIAASCALEYIDLLSPEIANERDKATTLLDFAVKMSGNANDVMQLCAFAYLKINDVERAATIFRRLVNEDYNTIVNAQLLSSIYVQAFLNGDSTAGRKYSYLQERIDEKYLFPFPQHSLIIGETNETSEIVQKRFVDNQKDILSKKYGIVINQFQEKYRILFGKCIPVPEGKVYSDYYFGKSSDAFEARKADGLSLKNKKNIAQYIEALLDADYPYNYLLVLNDMLNDASTLNCVQSHEDQLVLALSKSIIGRRDALKKLREIIDDGTKFSQETYNDMLDISYDEITRSFFECLARLASEYISLKKDIISINEAEMNLFEFCSQEGFDTPDRLYQTASDLVCEIRLSKQYLGVELIDEGILTSDLNNRFKEIKKKLLKERDRICSSGSTSKLFISGEEDFDRYFIKAGFPNKHEIRRKTIAILDDTTAKDKDLFFTIDGIMQISRGKMKDVVPYDDIEANADWSAINIHQFYSNEAVDMRELILLIEQLRSKPIEAIPDRINPLDLITKIIKR